MKVLLDTNILVRLCVSDDPKYLDVQKAILNLVSKDYELCVVPQVFYELWHVSTRPVEANGLGLSVAKVKLAIETFESMFTMLRDERTVYANWLRIVSHFKVLGRNSHDARLVAAMDRHGITQLLTLDGRDFNRFGHIYILRPADVIASN